LIQTYMHWILYPSKHILNFRSRSDIALQLHLLQQNYFVWRGELSPQRLLFGWSGVYWSDLFSSKEHKIQTSKIKYRELFELKISSSKTVSFLVQNHLFREKLLLFTAINSPISSLLLEVQFIQSFIKFSTSSNSLFWESWVKIVFT